MLKIKTKIDKSHLEMCFLRTLNKKLTDVLTYRYIINKDLCYVIYCFVNFKKITLLSDIIYFVFNFGFKSPNFTFYQFRNGLYILYRHKNRPNPLFLKDKI